MQRIGVVGIRREAALAADLRLEILPGPHMAKAGLVERRRGLRAGTVESRLGFSGRGPAFVTVHRFFPEPNAEMRVSNSSRTRSSTSP
jgi:hypothetical protein